MAEWNNKEKREEGEETEVLFERKERDSSNECTRRESWRRVVAELKMRYEGLVLEDSMID